MAQAVKFRRTKDDGVTANFWIYPPTGRRKKLRFTNNKAEATLEPGIQYQLYWIAAGPVGAKLGVERKVGADGTYSAIVSDWALPEDANVPVGWPVSFACSKPFTI